MEVVVTMEVVVHAPVVEVVVHGLVDGSRSLGVVVLRSSASVVVQESVDVRGSSVRRGTRRSCRFHGEGNGARDDACGTTANASAPADNGKKHGNQA